MRNPGSTHCTAVHPGYNTGCPDQSARTEHVGFTLMDGAAPAHCPAASTVFHTVQSLQSRTVEQHRPIEFHSSLENEIVLFGSPCNPLADQMKELFLNSKCDSNSRFAFWSLVRQHSTTLTAPFWSEFARGSTENIQ